MFWMPDERRCCPVERQGGLRQCRGPPATATERAGSADKQKMQKGHFPPGFSSQTWQHAEPVGAAGPRHPLQMAVNREVRAEIRKRTVADSSLHIRPDLPILPPIHSASGGYTARMLYPVFVPQRGDKPFISNVTRSRGRVVKSAVGPNP